MDSHARYIQFRKDWELVGVYTDEGISAINTKKRDGFKQMAKDALAGKIDLIVTKSIIQFARNTVDSLMSVHKLKEHGTEIYFEKESISTFDSKGDLLITIMSSLATEERCSISEEVMWGQRKRFSDGRVRMAYKQFLGYEKGEMVHRWSTKMGQALSGVFTGFFSKARRLRVSANISRFLIFRYWAVVASGAKRQLTAPYKRKVQGRCALAEKIHRRLFKEKDEAQ